MALLLSDLNPGYGLTVLHTSVFSAKEMGFPNIPNIVIKISGGVNPNNQISGLGMIYLFSPHIFNYTGGPRLKPNLKLKPNPI